MTRVDLITLQQIRDAKPCGDGWEKLLSSLGGAKTPLTTVVSIGDVVKSNGIQDALWTCRLIDDRRFLVSLVMPSVKRASRHAMDKRVHDCIASLDKWIAGDDTVDLEAATRVANCAATGAAAHAATCADACADAYERTRQLDDVISLSPLYALAQGGE